MLMTFIAAEGPNGLFFPSDIKEFWWGLVAFLIVVGLLWWRLAPLVKDGLNRGQQRAIDEATTAENAVADARAKIAEATAALGDANEETERILADANATAQRLRVDSANRTQQLVNDMWAKAQADAESMKTQAVADIQAEVAEQAVGAAEEVVRGSLDDAGQRQLIDDYISKLGAN